MVSGRNTEDMIMDLASQLSIEQAKNKILWDLILRHNVLSQEDVDKEVEKHYETYRTTSYEELTGFNLREDIKPAKEPEPEPETEE
ncbi:hypothetical protein [Sinobaca sp. H24]|uniref:hypothetical protein n=1 Tax=Sinobaca sp. H24 TaxID=2923376 RepID=UPI00207929A6|nr:hypothetical protein [Sinobaca sp. H24]